MVGLLHSSTRAKVRLAGALISFLSCMLSFLPLPPSAFDDIDFATLRFNSIAVQADDVDVVERQWGLTPSV